MSTAVQQILEQIERLPQQQRVELQSELSRLEEDEWAGLLREAREAARERGIDDEAITRAVESLRYGDDRAR